MKKFIKFLKEIITDGSWEYASGENMTADAKKALAILETAEQCVQSDGSGVLVDYNHHTKPLSTHKLRGTFRRR